MAIRMHCESNFVDLLLSLNATIGWFRYAEMLQIYYGNQNP